MDQRIIYIVSNMLVLVLVLVLDINYQQMSHRRRMSLSWSNGFKIQLRCGKYINNP